MTVVYRGDMNIPNYTALSTDVAAGILPGASKIGSTVFFTDTLSWKIIKSDLTLADYSSSYSGKVISVGDETVRLGGGDATPYAAGDAIALTTGTTATSALRSLAVGRIAGGSGYLTKFRLMTDQAACVATIRVHFYTVAQPTGPLVGDNVQMTLLYVNAAQRIGHLDFPAFTTSTVATNSTSAYSQNYVDRLPFQCAVADTNIYYRLETLSVFTPASGQKFYLEVMSGQD